MTAYEINYSLRPNKFVERILFIELLGIFVPNRPVEEYLYISLGGPLLEDHRLVHCRLGINNLISLEASDYAYRRQVFNRRPTYVECRNESTEDFIREFDAFSSEHEDKALFIWLDYTSPQNRFEQLKEYETILGKLREGDILKITINANAKTIQAEGDTRLEKIKAELDEYLPAGFEEEITFQNFPGVLCSTIQRASLKGSGALENLIPIPLALFSYADGPSPMLTATVCLVSENNEREFRDQIDRNRWEFLPESWEDLTIINVPQLSAKERLLIEELLFSKSIEDVHAELPFRLHSNEVRSLEMLKEYAKHYCRYPSFFQVPL